MSPPLPWVRPMSLAAAALWIAVSAAPAGAGCGSECSCPIENPGTHLDSRLLFEVSQLYISNYRVRAKDDVGDAVDEEESNTGGATLDLTPGLQWDAIPGFTIYGLAQFPVWERVNGIQVVAESNLVLGISRSIL